MRFAVYNDVGEWLGYVYADDQDAAMKKARQRFPESASVQLVPEKVA